MDENDDVSKELAYKSLADQYFVNDTIKCDEDGCTYAGKVHCEIDGEVLYHYCAKHAGENGFCHSCGTHIAGMEISLFSTLCDICRDEIEANDSFDEDE